MGHRPRFQPGVAAVSVRSVIVCCLAWGCVAAGTAFAVEIPAGQVVTLAGTGKPGMVAARSPALETALNQPFGLVIGPDGKLYVCETANHIISRIDLRLGTGEPATIERVVGSGKAGVTGDGGPALSADCHEPYEVRFDAEGNLYEVEMKGHVVRMVAAKTGTISRIAGTGVAGYAAEEDGGPAVKARLSVPHAIMLRDGRLYIADIGNHRVRAVDLKTGVISTVAGTGKKGPVLDGGPIAGTDFSGPRAIDFDHAGRMLLALREGNALHRIDFAANPPGYVRLAGTGKPGYSGDGGPATQALLNGPKGIAVARNGDIYLADTEAHAIRVVRAGDGRIETVVGDGKPGDGPDGAPRACRLNRPHGVFVDDSDILYIGDSSNHKVRAMRLNR